MVERAEVCISTVGLADCVMGVGTAGGRKEPTREGDEGRLEVLDALIEGPRGWLMREGDSQMTKVQLEGLTCPPSRTKRAHRGE